MKRKTLVISLLALLLSIVAFQTISYFIEEAIATNVITVGNMDIEVIEWSLSPDGDTTVPFKNVEDVLPGHTVSKIVEIKNPGDHDAYVRVGVTTDIKLVDPELGEVDTGLVSMDYNAEHWTYRDGWFYYNQPLKAGDTTTPLFRNVKFSEEIDSMYGGGTVTVDVFAQATQVENNGLSVFDAVGWPEPPAKASPEVLTEGLTGGSTDQRSVPTEGVNEEPNSTKNE